MEVGFGIDIGPAIAHVSHDMVERWDIAPEDVREQAMTNLRRRAQHEALVPSIRQLVGGVPVYWYESGDGWASALLLTPDELTRRVPLSNCLVVAPMRDLILSMPDHTEPEFAMVVRDEFAFEDPNGLDLPVFRLSDGRVTIIPVPADQLPRMH